MEFAPPILHFVLGGYKGTLKISKVCISMKIDTQSRKKKEKSNIHTDQNQACASLNTQLVGLLKKCCHK